MALSDEASDEGEATNVIEGDFGGEKSNDDEKSEKDLLEGALSAHVLAEVPKDPRTVEQLAVVCECTEKQVRNAVTALRRKYQSDSGDHIVSWKRQYWTAAELERRGHVLEATARGTLKVVKSTASKQGPGKKKKSPNKPKSKAKKSADIAAHVIEELGDSPDAQKVAKLIVARYDAFQEAEGELPRVRQKARDMIAATEAAFKEAIEEGLSVNDDAAAVQKLHNVEQAWQTKLEKKAEAVELRKEANETRNKARDAFAGVMENIRQLDLFADVA